MAAVAALALTAAPAADYAWNSTAYPEGNWSTASNWDVGGSPATTPPGATDNIITPLQVGQLGLHSTTETVNNWSFDGTSAWTVLGQNGTGGATLNITGTLTHEGTATLLFRCSGGVNNPLSLNVGHVAVSGTTALRLGEKASSSDRLNALTAGSMTIDGGAAGINVGLDNATATVTGDVSMSNGATLWIAWSVSTYPNHTLAVGSLTSADTASRIAANDYNGTETHGTLDINTAGSATYAGRLMDTTGGNAATWLAVEMNGTGTQTLTGNSNTYEGGTTVNSGTLVISNTTGSGTGTGAVMVTGGVLGGTGRIAPTGSNGLYVETGSAIAPGESIGSLTLDLGGTTGGASMIGGAELHLELGTAGADINSPGTSDQLIIASASADDVALADAILDFQGTGEEGWYKLLDTDLTTGTTWFGLTLSGQQITGGLDVTNLAAGLTATLVLGDGTSGDYDDIYVHVVPEPATLSLLTLGAATLLRRRRSA